MQKFTPDYFICFVCCMTFFDRSGFSSTKPLILAFWGLYDLAFENGSRKNLNFYVLQYFGCQRLTASASKPLTLSKVAKETLSLWSSSSVSLTKIFLLVINILEACRLICTTFRQLILSYVPLSLPWHVLVQSKFSIACSLFRHLMRPCKVLCVF